MGEGNASAGRGKEEGKKKKSYGGKPDRSGKVKGGECKSEEMRCPVLEPEVTQYPGDCLLPEEDGGGGGGSW